MTFLTNKIVWITGASSGIGKQLAIRCADFGAIVILSARSEEKLQEIKDQLKGERHSVEPLDLADSENFEVLTKKIIDKYGRIDYLFNNGGLSQRAKVVETTLLTDRYIMEVNYFGNIALTKAVLPYMIERKSGHIVVISSISGKFGFYLRSAYCASKHALQGFYESLAMEEQNKGIDVTIVYPGKINTPISLSAVRGDGQPHNKMDHNQSTGMSVEKCVEKILQKVKKKKIETLIGNKEILAVLLKRYLPQSWFWSIIKKQKAT